MKYKIVETTGGGIGLPSLTKVFKVLDWQKGDTVIVKIEGKNEIVIKKIEVNK